MLTAFGDVSVIKIDVSRNVYIKRKIATRVVHKTLLIDTMDSYNEEENQMFKNLESCDVSKAK